MSSAKLACCCGLAAIAISACGTTSRPTAGSVPTAAQRAGHAVVDDPRTKRLQCMQQHRLPATPVGQTDIQIGTPPSGPTVTFTPTPGAAQEFQINNQAPGAEVIGSALLYPHQAPDGELSVVETCLAIEVKG